MAIGFWGQRHLQYIKEYRKGLYTSLLISGRLNHYLADINRQAENAMLWIGKMNEIQVRAIVNVKRIYK